MNWALSVLFLLSAGTFTNTLSAAQGGKAGPIREADRRSPGYQSYQQANSFFIAKRLPEALSAIEESLRLDPNLLPALTLKAKFAMTASRFDLARECLERALAADPAAAYAQFLYGFQFYLDNDLERALPELQKARQLDPADPRAALYLGLTSKGLGRTSEALALYEETVRLERAANTPQAITFLTGARLLLLLGRLEDCDRWIRDALKVDPKSRDCHYELARLLLRKGDASHAAAEGEAALRLSKGDVVDSQIHFLLVRAYRTYSPADAARHAETLRLTEPATGSSVPGAVPIVK